MTTKELIQGLLERNPDDKLLRIAKELHEKMLFYARQPNGEGARETLDDCDVISGARYPWSRGSSYKG